MSSAASTARSAAAGAASQRRLAVTLDDAITPSSEKHNLLLGFHFGASTLSSDHPAVVSPGLQPVDGAELYECWWYEGDIDFTTRGNVRIAQCEDYAVLILQQPDAAPEDFRQGTRDAYEELLQVVQETEHRHLIKVWNYFAGINDGDGDEEKYRQFSIGRAEVFEQCGVLDDPIPTGTAIGRVRPGDLSIIALTSKHGLHAAENPRQVSAFKYPRQYGPKSPKFSRGGCVSCGRQKLFLFSGTAAIIGHESAHPYDVGPQTSETLENLSQLCDAIATLSTSGGQLALDAECMLRVYLRDPADREYVAGRLQELLGSTGSNLVFLHADICRRELMVEIDGVRVLC